VHFAPEASRRASLHEKNPSIKRIRSPSSSDGFGKLRDSPTAKRENPVAPYFTDKTTYADSTTQHIAKAQQRALANHESLDLDQQQWHNYVNFFVTTPTQPKHTTPLTVGTDCSGLDTPLFALAQLQIPHIHVFSSESDQKTRQVLVRNHHPIHLYDDVTTRDNSTTPRVDLYIAGFPCQPFSRAGLQQGFHDTKGRGAIFHYIHDYINKQRPNIFILENVKGLTTLNDGKYLKTILNALRHIGYDTHEHRSPTACPGAYNIYHSILNTKDHGVPQYRPRWYCVGILKSSLKPDPSRPTTREFEWPSKLQLPAIDSFLDQAAYAPVQHDPSPLNETAQKNLANAVRQIKEAGGDPDQDAYIVDIDASTQRSKWIHRM